MTIYLRTLVDHDQLVKWRRKFYEHKYLLDIRYLFTVFAFWKKKTEPFHTTSLRFRYLDSLDYEIWSSLHCLSPSLHPSMIHMKDDVVKAFCTMCIIIKFEFQQHLQKLLFSNKVTWKFFYLYFFSFAYISDYIRVVHIEIVLIIAHLLEEEGRKENRIRAFLLELWSQCQRYYIFDLANSR